MKKEIGSNENVRLFSDWSNAPYHLKDGNSMNRFLMKILKKYCNG